MVGELSLDGTLQPIKVFSAQKTDEKDENALIMETVREDSDNLTAYLAKLREVIILYPELRLFAR